MTNSNGDKERPPTKANTYTNGKQVAKANVPPTGEIGSPPKRIMDSTYRRAPRLGRPAMARGVVLSQNAARTTLKEDATKQTGKPPVASEENHQQHIQASGWVKPKLRVLPKHYPLDRYTAFLKRQGFDMDKFNQNMISCFRELSVEAKFCDDPVSAYIRSMEFVDIRVSLWLLRKSKDEIVVEVQHLRGSSMTFHQYAQVILEVARGNTGAMEHWKSAGGNKLDLKYLVAAEKLLNSQVDDAIAESSWTSALQDIHRLIMKGSLDEVLTGLQSLLIMTDPRLTGISTAVRFSDAIFLDQTLPEADAKCASEIRHVLVSLLLQNDVHAEIFDSFANARHCEEENSGEEMEVAKDYMFNLALGALSSSLELLVAVSDGCKEDYNTVRRARHVSASNVVTRFFSGINDKRNDLLLNLVNGLGSAKQKQHNAFLCAKLLSVLCDTSLSAEPMEGMLAERAIGATKDAYQVGVMSHSKLQEECARLWQVLVTN